MQPVKSLIQKFKRKIKEVTIENFVRKGLAADKKLLHVPV